MKINLNTKKINTVHLVGVCGTGMGAFAGMLKKAGYNVSGSDTNAYPPMSTQLNKWGIEIMPGFNKENITNDLDLVVIGNVCRIDNPEAVAARDMKLNYTSFPAALGELFLKNLNVIVIAGTHGKTTTTSLMSHILHECKTDPSFLVGGVPKNFDSGFRIGNGNYFAIEGDEYDTAYFDKNPKFLHYHPKYAILTGIEFDHADIYNSIEQIENAFKRFIDLIPVDGMLLVYNGCERSMALVKHAKCRVITYGKPNSDIYFKNLIIDNGKCFYSITQKDMNDIEIQSEMIGYHNILNTLASVGLAREIKLPDKMITKAVSNFKGIKRRQDIIGVINNITVMEDFAHHPTAVKETIYGVKKWYPKNRVWAVFEPRTNTSRSNRFQNEYVKAFEDADYVIIADVYNKEQIDEEKRFSPSKLIDEINKNVERGWFIPETKQIINFLCKNVTTSDIILIMSNGNFDGIHQQLIESLKDK